MKITFKLFATLTDYLPRRAKYTNQVALDIAPETTIGQLVEPYRLPEKLVHLVLVNGSYMAPEHRASRDPGRRRCAGHLATDCRGLTSHDAGVLPRTL